MTPEEAYMRRAVQETRQQRRESRRQQALRLLGQPADPIEAALWRLERLQPLRRLQ